MLQRILESIGVRVHSGEVRESVLGSRTSAGLYAATESIIEPTIDVAAPIVEEVTGQKGGWSLGGVARGVASTVRSGMAWARRFYSHGSQAGTPPSVASVPPEVAAALAARADINVSQSGTLWIAQLEAPTESGEKLPFGFYESSPAVPIMGISPGLFDPESIMAEVEVDEAAEVYKVYLAEGEKWAGWAVIVGKDGIRKLVPGSEIGLPMPGASVPVYGIILD